MRALTRMWQMLLKALEEAATAPNAMMAAEMAIIRLTHVADLPSPEELVRRLAAATPPVRSAASAAPASPRGDGPAARAVAAPVARAAQATASVAKPEARSQATPEGRAAVAPETREQAAAAVAGLARYATFEDVVALVRARRDVSLLLEIETGLRLVRYSPGRIEFEPDAGTAADFAPRLAQRLQAWTGVRWGVSVVATGGGATLAETATALRDDLMARAQAHPMVQAALASFPGAVIRDIRPPGAIAGGADVGPEEDDAWDPLDPFDEE